MSSRICVIGSANMDLVFRTSRLPRAGETLSGHGFQQCFGGKGANQAVMAARLGAQVAMIAKVGGDTFGEHYLANFRDNGIDVAHVSRDAIQPTGCAAIIVDERGENCIIVVPGANEALTDGDVWRAEPVLTSARLVVGQLEVPLEATMAAFGIARKAGATTLLNPAPVRELPSELLHLTNICVVNEVELESLSGTPVNTEQRMRDAARQLLAAGPSTVVLTLGAAGAAVFEQDRTEFLPGLPVPVIDTTGAGDAFIGSLVAFLAHGRDRVEAARRANAIAAFTVTRAGTQSSYPSRQECQAMNG